MLRANRRWLAEVVERLLREAAVLQFLDLGSGLPTADNTHEIAARVSSGATVVYLDKDPTVIRHGQALRAGFRAVTFRTPAEIASLFEGLELLDPGLVSLGEWWPSPAAELGGAGQLIAAGLARKP